MGKVKIVTSFDVDDKLPMEDTKEMSIEDAIYHLSSRVARIEYVLEKLNTCL